MLQINNDLCILCGLCADVCPNEAIIALNTYRIDQSACTQCGECVHSCPKKAIINSAE